MGTGIGAAGGAVLGAALGSVGGPLGIMVGGTIGALAGGLTGKEVAESFDPALETTYWQEHYRDEPYVEPEYDYDDYGPAYLLGAGRQEFHRSFEEAEKGMEEGWEDLKDQSRIPWEKARHAARAGWVRHEQVISALELAALRGVEVRILIPDQCDSSLVNLSGWAYVERLGKVGVHFYRHSRDFMHQKVTLVDDGLATVGSANLDNRSFRLNFEMTVEVRDEVFAGQVATMLERDFAEARRVDPKEVYDRGFLFRLKVRSAILMSPIQ